jgi:CBS domain-containing protein
MPVEDVARTGVVSAHRDQSAGNLATVMKEENVGSVVVIDEDRPVGIVTDRDLVLDVLEPRGDPSAVTAGEIMTETPVHVTVDAGIFEAIRVMRDHSVRRLPVVDSEETLAGIVTLDDLVVMLADELDNLAAVVEAESPPY